MHAWIFYFQILTLISILCLLEKRRRYDIKQEVPEELSILLHCVSWNERDEVAEMWHILKEWPTISVERALELLDYAYPDPAVRKFAIRCLNLLK